jgi:lysophospholipase L1-like esterase
MVVMRRTAPLLVALLVTSLTALTSATPTASAATPPPPSSMAAIGDSITRATDVCCWYGDHPGSSWSTGGNAFDGVRSQYERIRSLNPDIIGHRYNDAVAGARMSAGPTQAQSAVTQRARYVTVLMGANDLCTSSPSTMTGVATFRDQFRRTLATLFAGLPSRAHVSVSSIPDVYQLWRLYHTSSTARLVWSLGRICQSLLAPTRTEAGRQLVRQRNIAFNSVLRQECAAYVRCRYDGGAVFGYAFTRDDVSRLDFFHPSLSGQAALARVSWNSSWWG